MLKEEVIKKLDSIYEAKTLIEINDLLGYSTTEELKDLPSVNPQESKTEKIIKMRDATPEEKESIDEYIKSISQPSEDCIDRQSLIDNWNSCADMLMSEGDSEIVMGWIFNAPSVTPTQEPVLDKIRTEIVEYKDDKVIHAERNEMIDIVLEIIDKYKAESEEEK